MVMPNPLQLQTERLWTPKRNKSATQPYGPAVDPCTGSARTRRNGAEQAFVCTVVLAAFDALLASKWQQLWGCPRGVFVQVTRHVRSFRHAQRSGISGRYDSNTCRSSLITLPCPLPPRDRHATVQQVQTTQDQLFHPCGPRQVRGPQWPTGTPGGCGHHHGTPRGAS